MANSISGRKENQAPDTQITHFPAGALPQTASQDIFAILFGSVCILGVYGRVTTAMDATVTNLTVTFGGPAGTGSASNATAITSLGVGTLISYIAPATNLGTGGAVSGPTSPIAAGPSNSGIRITTSANNAGRIEWFVVWRPLHPAGEVVTAIGGPRGMKVRAARFYHKRRATTTLPQTTQTPIFTVRGGPCRIYGIVGLVTTATGATATNASLIANQTAAGIADFTLASATSIASLGVNTMVSLAATGSALATGNTAATVGNGPIVDVGTIDLLTSGSNTGSIEWYILYETIHQGAVIFPV